MRGAQEHVVLVVHVDAPPQRLAAERIPQGCAGIVANVHPALDAAFVNYGADKDGLLRADDIVPSAYHRQPQEGERRGEIDGVGDRAVRAGLVLAEHDADQIRRGADEERRAVRP